MKLWMVAVVVCLAGAGCKDGREAETYDAMWARLRKEAPEAARSACTNEVAGLKQIVSLTVADGEDNVGKWSGQATLDYVNKLGGVERTNLALWFTTGGIGKREVYALVDHSREEHERLRQATKRSDEVLKNN